MPLREALLTVACLCVALASQTQEPFCPRTVLNAANRHTPVQVGLSGYSFHEVFGASAADMASRGLQCSEVCDGLALADSMRCSGPHACGRRTCLMGDGERVPRACPAEAVTGAESAEELAAKVGEECVECEKCEGRGCARECSQLLCYDGQVYDWTTRQCHACTDLRNPELCAASNGFAQRRVSGDVPQVRFDGCVPRGESTLLDVRYGSCQECPFQTCAHDQFPDHGCVCSPCMRAGASHGFYFDENGALAVTYCQAMACEPGRVGVHPDGVTCKRVCAPRVCGAGERLVPCRHPIDTLCVANWPPLLRTKSMWSNASYTYAQLARVLETNLLESSVASGFASFENALVDTLESLPDNHIQCVYNARNVFEDMHPGGVSVHFTGMEGKTCRERETYASSRRPLLPLQNVAALGHGTPITQRVRRVHADTPARAALWSFNGVSHDADVPDTAPAPRREGAAANEVYLIVDTLGESGRVRVPVIDDRGLRHWPFGWRVQFWALDVDPDPDSAASAALDIVAQVVAGIEVESMLPDSTLDLLAPGAWTERGDEVLSGVYEAQPAGCASVYVSVEPASATRIAECEQQDYSSYYNPCSTYSPLWRAARLFSLSVNASSTLELVSFLPPDTTSVHFIRNSNLGLVVRPSELMLLKENSDQTQGLHLELQPWRSAVAGLRYTHGVVVNDAIVIDGGYRDLILYNMLSSDGNSTWKSFYVHSDLSLIPLQIVVEHPAWTQNIIAMATHDFELVIAIPSFAQENSNCTSLNCVQLYVCSLFGDVSGKQLIVHDTRSSQDSAFMESMSTDLKVSAMDVTVIRSNADHHSEYWEITTVFVYMQEENGYEYVYARVCPFKGRPGKRSDVCLRTADGQLASRRLVQKKSSVPVTQLSVAWVGAHHSLADAVVSAAGRRYVVRVYKTHFELRERFYGPPAGKYTTVLFDDTFIIRSDYPGAMLVLQPDPQQPGGDLRLSLLVPPPWTRLQSPSPAQAVLKLGGADCKFSTRSGLRVDGNSISSIADVFRTQTAQLRSPSVLEFGDAHGNSRNAHGYSRNAHGHSRLEGNLLRIPDLTIHGVLMGYLETAQAAHLGDARLTLRNETVLIKATRNSGSFRFEAKVAGAVVDLRVLDAGALWWGEVSSAGIKIKNTTSGAVVSTQSYAAQELVVEMTLVGDASWTLERVDVELLTSVSRKTVSVSKEAWTLVAGSLPAGSDVPPRLDIIVNGSSAAIAIDDVSLQARVGPGSTVVIDAATVAKWEELGLAVQSTAGGAGWRRVHVMVLAAAGGPPAQAVQVRPVQSARSVFCGTGEACVLEVPASWLPLRVDGILLEVVPAPVQWECAPDEHHHNGRCEACGGVCAPGTYDDRCAALESDVTCAHACPNDLPDAAAVYLPGWFLRDGVCPWTCVSGYVRRFADERDGNGCVPCSHVDCEPGFEPGTCSGSTDTVCEPCDVSRFGDFWQNERFTAGCNTTCVDGTFRVQGVCMPCSTPAELLSGVVREEGVFYAFEACSANADTRAVACATVPNGRAVADAGAAGEACPFACDVGFRATSEGSCARCPALLGFDGSEVPHAGYMVDSQCRVTCRAPYVNRTVDGKSTCAACNASCAVGQYRTGGMCEECKACAAPAPGFVHVSDGALDDPTSCRAECAPGTFNQYGFGTCVAHSVPVCTAKQYLRAGTAVHDAFCANCSTCEGQRLTHACSATADAQCESCGEAPPGTGWAGAACAVACSSGWAWNTRALRCEFCDVFACPPGQAPPAIKHNCTHCEPCSAPANVVFVDGCTYVCANGFEMKVEGTGAEQIISCTYVDSNDNRRKMRDVNVRCEDGFRLNAAYLCEPCPELVPADNSTWLWSGAECEWTCAGSLMRHARAASVACVTKEQLDVETQLEHGTSPDRWQHAKFNLGRIGFEPETRGRTIVLISASVVVFGFVVMFFILFAIKNCRRREQAPRQEQVSNTNPHPTQDTSQPEPASVAV